jgi:uncharacterized membrane protein YoaK (UPF0700 family)
MLLMESQRMMDVFTDAARTIVPRRDDRHGPLPPLLLVLTIVTGLVDAVSYLKLGHVFVANMTGNVVFLGFAIAGASDLSIAASLVALAAFMAGALMAARVGARFDQHRGHRLAVAIAVKLAFVAAAMIVAIVAGDQLTDAARYVSIALLAFAMGVQNATARKLAVPDLTTTVLTLTVTGLAADSRLAGGASPHPGRRLVAIVAMLVGAIVGGMLVLHVSISAALGFTAGLLLLAGLAVYRLSAASAPWAAPT